METMPRPRAFATGLPSHSQRDVSDERYQELRRPRKVRFFCNGDRYFKGKKIYITPHRYLNFNDLLHDLTGKLPGNLQLPYGVRNIYTPSGGHRVSNIETMQDGEDYVCAGFEGFKNIKYGGAELHNWTTGGYLVGKPQSVDFFGDVNFSQSQNLQGRRYGAFQPGRPLRNSFPPRRFGGRLSSQWGTQSTDASSSIKPKVVTVVRSGPTPRSTVKILLNRRSVQSYEQMVKDISEAFGPKWKQDKLRKLYTVKGREIQGISDFFRDDDVFIAIGQHSLSSGDVQEILTELYPEGNTAKNLMKEWDKLRKKNKTNNYNYKSNKHVKEKVNDVRENKENLNGSKIDSGLGSDEGKDEEKEDIISEEPSRSRSPKKNKPESHEQDLVIRLERERLKAAEEERDKARKRAAKSKDTEKRALDEEKRKRGLVPLKSAQDPFKKMQEDKEAEREKERGKEKERQQRAAQEKARQEEAEELERQEKLKAAREKEKRKAKAQEEKEAQNKAKASTEAPTDSKLSVVSKEDKTKKDSPTPRKSRKDSDHVKEREELSATPKSEGKLKVKGRKESPSPVKKKTDVKSEKGSPTRSIGKPEIKSQKSSPTRSEGKTETKPKSGKVDDPSSDSSKTKPQTVDPKKSSESEVVSKPEPAKTPVPNKSKEDKKDTNLDKTKEKEEEPKVESQKPTKQEVEKPQPKPVDINSNVKPTEEKVSAQSDRNKEKENAYKDKTETNESGQSKDESEKDKLAKKKKVPTATLR